MEVKIHPSWAKILEDEFKKPYFRDLTDFVRLEYMTKTVYPPPQKIFDAFELCPFDSVKVVILGQDPYHGPGQANGLSFSVNDGVRLPPSLQNIYKEIEDDLGKKMPPSGNLERWARQGVLLLNATLSVAAGQAGSHQMKGWEVFTDAVIQKVSKSKEHIVFLLWGNYARAKKSLIDVSKHLVLEAPHPSPFSASSGFFGCKHFSKANAYLKVNEETPIDW